MALSDLEKFKLYEMAKANAYANDKVFGADVVDTVFAEIAQWEQDNPSWTYSDFKTALNTDFGK